MKKLNKLEGYDFKDIENMICIEHNENHILESLLNKSPMEIFVENLNKN